MGLELTVGELLDYIEKNKISRETKIAYQRIEDRYFEGNDISGFPGCTYTEDGRYPEGSKNKGWDTIKTKGDSWYYLENLEGLIKSGELEEDMSSFLPTEEQYENSKDQFVEVFTCYLNKEYPKNLFLTAHY